MAHKKIAGYSVDLTVKRLEETSRELNPQRTALTETE